MAEAHHVGKRSALTEQRHLEAKVGDRAVALFLDRGRVVATQGTCPHAGGPLHKGTVCDGKLSCPWHGWTYDLASGACEESDDITLVRYEVRVDGDDLFVIL